MTKAKEVIKIINDAKEGTLFCIKDFLDITSYDNAKLILSRLENRNVIKRAYDGLYYRPSYSKIAQRYVPVSPLEFVSKIAELNKWHIILYGDSALNYLSLSTQVPATFEFVTDGPYREYVFDGMKIRFRHTNFNYIKVLSNKSATLIEALRFLGKDRVDEKIIDALKLRMTNKEIKELIEFKQYYPVWIYKIIYKLGGLYIDKAI